MRPEILDYLTQCRQIKTYAPGEIIFRQGEIPTELFYLISGLSLTYTVFEDGRERNILMTWPGRLFGAATFFEAAPRRSSAIAIKPCEVIVIDQEGYRQCCQLFPDFQEFILRELSKDIGALFEELADSSMLSADIRVARFLCRRLAENQYSGTAELPELHYSQEFLANVIGISRISITQVIARFVDRGWISTGYRKIIIHNPAALRTFSYERIP